MSNRRQKSSVPLLCTTFIICNLPVVVSFMPSWKLRRPNRLPSQKIKRNNPLRMSLVPIPVDDLTQLLPPNLPTPEQYTSYWGRTSRERYAALFESTSITIVGLLTSYFFSFVVGTPLATFAGTVAAFWILLGPELKAYQRNWELRAGRDIVDYYDEDAEGEGLFGACFFGSVANVAVVEGDDAPPGEEYPLEDFWDYRMEDDERERLLGLTWKLRLRMEDGEGRTLQVHAKMSEAYLGVEVGMPVAGVLLSVQRDFGLLAGLTDFFIPDLGVWVGDYPYLDKAAFERWLSTRRFIRLLERERVEYEESVDDEDELGEESMRSDDDLGSKDEMEV